jgi:ribosomal protein S18 acetylase RimI-like enzyme
MMERRRKRGHAEVVIRNALTASPDVLKQISHNDRRIIVSEQHKSLLMGYYTSGMARQLTVSNKTTTEPGLKDISLTDWMFNLTKSNMKHMYEECPGWGWDDDEKYKELEDEKARFLVVSDSSSSNHCSGSIENTEGSMTELDTPVAFVHLRYETEELEPVVYIYEIQVLKTHQGLKLGWWLMNYVEALGRFFTFPVVMLTVFTRNDQARTFYSRLGYSVDPSSPEDQDGSEEEGQGYLILSKNIETQ